MRNQPRRNAIPDNTVRWRTLFSESAQRREKEPRVGDGGEGRHNLLLRQEGEREGGKRGSPGERVMEREKKERKRAIALWIDNDQIGRTGAVGQG